MANKKQAPRPAPRRRPFSRPMRYDQQTLREEREYGVFWYAWLWRILRPVLIFLCAVLIVIGSVSYTHLDVYKRQRLGGLVQISTMMGNIIGLRLSVS